MPSSIEQQIKSARAELARLEAERHRHRTSAIAFVRRAMSVLGVSAANLGLARVAASTRAAGRSSGARLPGKPSGGQGGSAAKRSKKGKGHGGKAVDGRSVVKPKFRGPNGELWSGRGRTPRWLTALEADGKNRSSFAIR